MSWKKFFTGEPMPDKNDPKYRERYEREVEAGRKFANASGISWLSAKLQSWGQNHKALVLLPVLAFVTFCFLSNLINLVQDYKSSEANKAVAVERVDSALRVRSASNK